LKVIGDQVGAKQMLSAPETETSCAHEWRRPKGSKPARRAGCLSALQAFSHPDPDPEGQRLSLPAQLVSKSLQQMGRTEGKKAARNNPAAADGMLLS